MDIFYARQPIFDCRLRVFAYELLFRSGSTATTFDGSDAFTATAKVINAIFFSEDGQRLLRGKPAFINFPQEMLLSGAPEILPSSSTVVEVLETVEPTAEIVEACKRLHSRNYRLALDDFAPNRLNPLTRIADFVKIDYRATSPRDQQSIARRLGGTAAMLAEKVESLAEFERARSMGYQYFQGYFFARPVITQAREIPSFKLNYLKILQDLRSSDFDAGRVARLITREPSLSYKLLRFVNSALIGSRNRIRSIAQALIYLGEEQARRWLSVIVILDLASDKPGELLIQALFRARFCELLAPLGGLAGRAEELFLLGLFSLLDVMLGRPISEVLSSLALPEDIARTLCGQAPEKAAVSAILQIVLAYESGDWSGFARLAKILRVNESEVPELYRSSMEWTSTVFQV